MVVVWYCDTFHYSFAVPKPSFRYSCECPHERGADDRQPLHLDSVVALAESPAVVASNVTLASKSTAAVLPPPSTTASVA
jgi:hypothetical protein